MQVFVTFPLLLYDNAMCGFGMKCAAYDEHKRHLNGWNDSRNVVVGLDSMASMALAKVRSFQQSDHPVAPGRSLDCRRRILVLVLSTVCDICTRGSSGTADNCDGGLVSAAPYISQKQILVG